MKTSWIELDPALGYIRALLVTRVARMRDGGDRGATAIELAIITAVLVGLAVVVLGIIVHFATAQGNSITKTSVPNPAGGGN